MPSTSRGRTHGTTWWTWGEIDYQSYLNFLTKYDHNFIRLWAWDSTVWDTRANGRLAKDFVHHAAPLPWARTGPGNALDGKPKFDLTNFDPAYFDRLRARGGGARTRYLRERNAV
jgi:hypothetical protein